MSGNRERRRRERVVLPLEEQPDMPIMVAERGVGCVGEGAKAIAREVGE